MQTLAISTLDYYLYLAGVVSLLLFTMAALSGGWWWWWRLCWLFWSSSSWWSGRSIFSTRRQCIRVNRGFVSLFFTSVTCSQTFLFVRSAILANNWPGGFHSTVLNTMYCVSDVRGLYGLDLNGVTLHYVVAPTRHDSRIDKLLIGCVLKKVEPWFSSQSLLLMSFLPCPEMLNWATPMDSAVLLPWFPLYIRKCWKEARGNDSQRDTEGMLNWLIFIVCVVPCPSTKGNQSWSQPKCVHYSIW